MTLVTFPDGAEKSYSDPISIADLAVGISNRLAKDAIAGVVDDQLVDLTYVLNKDAKVKIITAKDPEGIEIIRHSCAHILAQAVQNLFPEVQVTIGPVVENGFYYDFAYKESFTEYDLLTIEKKMQEIIKQNLPIQRKTMTRDDAIKFFRDKGESYKVELVEAIPDGGARIIFL